VNWLVTVNGWRPARANGSADQIGEQDEDEGGEDPWQIGSPLRPDAGFNHRIDEADDASCDLPAVRNQLAMPASMKAVISASRINIHSGCS
jgi:hypothetical protein